MPQWLQVLFGIAAIVGPFLAAFAGVKVGLAVAQAEITMLKDEVKELRKAKHEHANILTRHSLRLRLLDGQDEE